MLRSTFGWTFVLCMALIMQSRFALAQPPTIFGTWTGTAALVWSGGSTWTNEAGAHFTVARTGWFKGATGDTLTFNNRGTFHVQSADENTTTFPESTNISCG